MDNKVWICAGIGAVLAVVYFTSRGETLDVWQAAVAGENQWGQPQGVVSIYNCALCARDNCPCGVGQSGVTTETLSVPVASFDPNKQAPNSDMIYHDKLIADRAKVRQAKRAKCYNEACAPCGRDYPYFQFIVGQCPP